MEFKEIKWEGYSGIEFEFDGLPAKLIRPTTTPNGKWVYKTEYFGAFPSAEFELLRRGYHVAYNQNIDRWAEPYDLARKVEFMRFISDEFGLSQKCSMVGMSCGGMYAVKLAAIVPEFVSCLYLDAPVINLLSCPFALGKADRVVLDEYIKITGRGIPEILSYREHPLDKFPILAKHNIPVILVGGDSDRVVPFEENGALLEAYYKSAGCTIETYLKKNCDHHPHGLDDPKIIADFIDKHS